MFANRAIASVALALIVIALILVAGFGIYFGVSSNSGTGSANSVTSLAGSTRIATISSAISQTTSSSNSTITVQTSNSTQGLQLMLSVNSETIPSEDAIDVTVSTQNTLSTMNNLSASDHWAARGMPGGVCNYGNSTDKLFSPEGLAVFRGNYGMNNLSSAVALGIWGMAECPVDYAFNGSSAVGILENITSYSFLPRSNSGYYSAFYVDSRITKGVFPTRMIFPATIYAANASAGPNPYNSLGSSVPSEYTLVAGDEWGQIVLLHFQVVKSTNLPIVGEFLSSPSVGGCTENGNPVPCISSEFSDAVIFNCVSAASTSAGCTEQLISGVGNFSITFWYPYINQSGEPASANCKFSVKNYDSSPYGYCFLVNSTAFAISY